MGLATGTRSDGDHDHRALQSLEVVRVPGVERQASHGRDRSDHQVHATRAGVPVGRDGQRDQDAVPGSGVPVERQELEVRAAAPSFSILAALGGIPRHGHAMLHLSECHDGDF